MSSFSDICKTGFELYRGDVTVDELVKEKVFDGIDRFTSPSKRVPDSVRYEHLLATGRTGCGKSSYLYGLMAKDIPLALQRKRTMIYIDPVNGIDKVVKETGICEADNVFLIDPADPDSLPRLNMFETGIERQGMLATTHMINTFKSVCSGLIDQVLTPPMMTLFGYCARVLMNVPNRTLHDLMALLLNPIEFMDIAGIDPEDPAYRFFMEDVIGTNRQKGASADTVKYVRNRAHAFLNDPIIERLLINRKPTLSLAKVIEHGSILLVATRKTDLGEDGCRLLGKFIKSIVNRIVQERSHVEIDTVVPIFFYEDEFQNSLSGGYDKTLAGMLDENRKFKLSINLATTRFGHISTDMGDAVLTCMATKVCGTMVGKGANSIAPELGRTVKELTELPRYRLFVKSGSGQKKAMEVRSQKDPFKKTAKNNPRAMKTLRTRMTHRFGTGYVERKKSDKAEQSGIEDVEM
ncbi:MAG: hypothetical protein ACR2QF_00910 [Geminicoccaceae bacterium]